MNVDAFLRELQADPAYAGQIVHVRREPARAATYATPDALPPGAAPLLERLGIPALYAHQARAVAALLAGRDVVIATGAASGKSLCYFLPILLRLAADPTATALLLYPTKALCQDQFRAFAGLAERAGLSRRLAGVLDGDTPAPLRRRLRERASVLFSNPDMIHASLLPQHGRWARFLGGLGLLVVDELHACNGLFGANAALLFRRLLRVGRHHGRAPALALASATLANPLDLARRLFNRDAFELVDRDASPRGPRTTVLWNPPRIRAGDWRSRRSANVEAHELMARLIAAGAPTIAFSKARLTAEMIYRYVRDTLRTTAPGLLPRLTPYRGGYPPGERRRIEQDLFAGRLLGVSATPALELGLDVGEFEAAILVGYPGTRASFLQQAGRAGRRDAEALVILVALDTSINQYLMTHPEYLFDTGVEETVADPDNPFVLLSHLRCAAQELPLAGADLAAFGPAAGAALRVLEAAGKLVRRGGLWHHAASETPQHETPLRAFSDATVLVQDADTGEVLEEVDRLDAPPLLHPQAVYLRHGETYVVTELDLERNLARIRREDTDYYTQPVGGTDVHHIDRLLRAKPFGAGRACWGEVTAYSRTHAYTRIHFYSLDTIDAHPLTLPAMPLETMAFWLIPPDALMEQARADGLDAHSGLRGIGYAARMLLPLVIACDTRDFSHTVGGVNSPWNAVFVFERFPMGLGFTERAYGRLHDLMPAVLKIIRECPCDTGCPCCVGKPLRQTSLANVELGEGAIPSKAAARFILQGLLGDGSRLNEPDDLSATASDADADARLEQALRRRLDRAREPQTFHPITPAPALAARYPAPETPGIGPDADADARQSRRAEFERRLRRVAAKRIPRRGLHPLAPKPPVPPGMKTDHGVLKPTDFPGRPRVFRR